MQCMEELQSLYATLQAWTSNIAAERLYTAIEQVLLLESQAFRGASVEYIRDRIVDMILESEWTDSEYDLMEALFATENHPLYTEATQVFATLSAAI